MVTRLKISVWLFSFDAGYVMKNERSQVARSMSSWQLLSTHPISIPPYDRGMRNRATFPHGVYQKRQSTYLCMYVGLRFLLSDMNINPDIIPVRPSNKTICNPSVMNSRSGRYPNEYSARTPYTQRIGRPAAKQHPACKYRPDVCYRESSLYAV